MKRGKPPQRRARLERRTSLRNRSPRRVRVMVQRRHLVEDLLTLYPRCVAHLPGCTVRAVDVHEVVSRARGGDLLDERVCITLCRRCHDAVTRLELPTAELERRGLAFPSGTDPSRLVRTYGGELVLDEAA